MTTTAFLAAIQAAIVAANGEMTLQQYQGVVTALTSLDEDGTLRDWLEDVETAIAASAATIKTVKIGYLHELETGQTSYDVLLIVPPVYKIATPRNWTAKEFIPLTWYIIRQNKGATGDLMTDAERTAAWSALDLVNRLIIEKLQETPTAFQIVDEVRVEYNSGGPQQLLSDNVVWIEVNFKCRINDC